MLNFIIPAIAGVASAAIGSSGQRSSNAQNVALSRDQMEFQERMSSTAYQRARDDMEKAGFNPMLAYSQGGASSPVGSMPQVQNVAAAGMNAAASTLGMLQAVQQVQQSKAQAELLAAQTEKVRSETLEKDLHTADMVAKTRGRGAASDLQEQERDYRSSEGSKGNLIRQDFEKARAAVTALQAARDKDSFSADVARRKAESDLRQLDIPFRKSEAEFWDKVGDLPQGMRLLMEMIRLVTSARSAGR